MAAALGLKRFLLADHSRADPVESDLFPETKRMKQDLHMVIPTEVEAQAVSRQVP
jgi:hypothetical protein